MFYSLLLAGALEAEAGQKPRWQLPKFQLTSPHGQEHKNLPQNMGSSSGPGCTPEQQEQDAKGQGEGPLPYPSQLRGDEVRTRGDIRWTVATRCHSCRQPGVSGFGARKARPQLQLSSTQRDVS